MFPVTVNYFEILFILVQIVWWFIIYKFDLIILSHYLQIIKKRSNYYQNHYKYFLTAQMSLSAPTKINRAVTSLGLAVALRMICHSCLLSVYFLTGKILIIIVIAYYDDLKELLHQPILKALSSIKINNLGWDCISIPA